MTKQRHDTLSTDDRAPCWFAEQQRLQDLERRYRQALHEFLFAADDDQIEEPSDSGSFVFGKETIAQFCLIGAF